MKLLAPIKPPMLYAAPQLPGTRGGHGGTARVAAGVSRPSVANYRSVHAIVGTEENIVVPADCSGAVQPEGQLAVVIGRTARKVPVSEALDYVFGYTIGNDISQRPWQQADRTMFRGKNCDTWKPWARGSSPTLTPRVPHHSPPQREVWEDFSSADQIWDTATWIHELSNYATLYPGDVLWMGTEGADGDMFPRDTIEVEISGIGGAPELRGGGGVGGQEIHR